MATNAEDIRRSENSSHLSEHVTLYRNLDRYQVIVLPISTQSPERLEKAAAELMDAAATLRNLQQGGER